MENVMERVKDKRELAIERLKAFAPKTRSIGEREASAHQHC